MFSVKSDGTKHRQPRFLVILFNTLEYDGRARRMVEILRTIGRVILIDIASSDVRGAVLYGDVERVATRLPAGLGRRFRHVRLLLVAIRMARCRRPDIVVAEDYFCAFSGWVSAKMVGARLVYDAHELIITESSTGASLRDRVWAFLERLVAPRADLIIAANHERAELMAKHYCLSKMPTYMRNIPAANPERVAQSVVLEAYPALKELGNRNHVLLYQGDISLRRGIGRFLEVLRLLPPPFRLLVVGVGQDLDRLRSMASELEREGRFISIGRVPNNLLRAVSELAGIGIVTYPCKGLNNIYCAPNKLFEYAQAGLPVISTNQPPLAALVSKYGVGELLTPNHTALEIANLVLQVSSRLERYRSRLSSFLEANQWRTEASRISGRIESMLDNLR